MKFASKNSFYLFSHIYNTVSFPFSPKSKSTFYERRALIPFLWPKFQCHMIFFFFVEKLVYIIYIWWNFIWNHFPFHTIDSISFCSIRIHLTWTNNNIVSENTCKHIMYSCGMNECMRMDEWIIWWNGNEKNIHFWYKYYMKLIKDFSFSYIICPLVYIN